MDKVLTPAEARSAKLMNMLGLGLIAAAFVVPFLAIPLGWGSAFSAGQDVVRTLGSLALLSLIAWLATRNRTSLGKANARAVVGLLLCVVVGNNIYARQKEEQLAKDFMRQSLVFQEQQAQKFADLGARFDKVDLSTILTPTSMTTQAGMDRARAQLSQYRALLAERRLLLQTYLSEAERRITSLPEGETRRGASAPLEEGKTQTSAIYAALDRTQGALTDALEAVLDWGQSQAGKLGAKNGQLLFTSREQQAQLQVLLAKVQEAETEMNAEVSAAQKRQVEAQAKMRENNRQIKDLLAK